jgi:hypothetical protein
MKNCYYSKIQLLLMQGLGCNMKVSLNGKPVSQITDFNIKHNLLEDEIFVGSSSLEDILCEENKIWTLEELSQFE